MLDIRRGLMWWPPPDGSRVLHVRSVAPASPGAPGLDGLPAPRCPRPIPAPSEVLARALVHLLLTGTPLVRRPSAPAARVARALQLPLAPDRLRRLHGTVWIASTRHIPAP